MFAKLSWKMFSTHDFWFSGKLQINADLHFGTLGPASQRKGLFWNFMFLHLCLHESFNFYQVWLFLIDYRTFEYPKIRSIYLSKPPCSQSSLQRFEDAIVRMFMQDVTQPQAHEWDPSAETPVQVSFEKKQGHREGGRWSVFSWISPASRSRVPWNTPWVESVHCLPANGESQQGAIGLAAWLAWCGRLDPVGPPPPHCGSSQLLRSDIIPKMKVKEHNVSWHFLKVDSKADHKIPILQLKKNSKWCNARVVECVHVKANFGYTFSLDVTAVF